MTDKNKWTNCDFIDYGDYRNDEAEREKWLEIRRGFIGGSDAGAFNPESKYKSPYLLYADKKGNAKPFTGNEATRRGNLLERGDCRVQLCTNQQGSPLYGLQP